MHMQELQYMHELEESRKNKIFKMHGGRLERALEDSNFPRNGLGQIMRYEIGNKGQDY